MRLFLVFTIVAGLMAPAMFAASGKKGGGSHSSGAKGGKSGGKSKKK